MGDLFVGTIEAIYPLIRESLVSRLSLAAENLALRHWLPSINRQVCMRWWAQRSDQLLA